MTTYTSVDVSEFQTAATDAYPHRWISFRAFDGTYDDHRYPTNLAWAKSAKARGRLDGFTVYFVWRPGVDPVARLNALNVPTDCTVMIDVESWGGAITGNRSAELNTVAERVAARQGSYSRVWGYANRGDYAGLWPQRPAWLGCVLASYGGGLPSFPNLVGWQYTNGQAQYDGVGVSSSAPFGRCDHNQFFITPEDIVTPAEIEAVAQRSCALVVAALKKGGILSDLNTQTAQLQSFINGGIGTVAGDMLIRVATVQKQGTDLAAAVQAVHVTAQGVDPAVIQQAAKDGARQGVAGATISSVITPGA
jgi:hypothetical protein